MNDTLERRPGFAQFLEDGQSLSDQQYRRAEFARDRAPAQFLAVRRLRPRRSQRRVHVHTDRHRQDEKCRVSGLARHMTRVPRWHPRSRPKSELDTAPTRMATTNRLNRAHYPPHAPVHGVSAITALLADPKRAPHLANRLALGQRNLCFPRAFIFRTGVKRSRLVPPTYPKAQNAPILSITTDHFSGYRPSLLARYEMKPVGC